MLETEGVRRPTGCTVIVTMLLSASLLASVGCAQLPRTDSPPAGNKLDRSNCFPNSH
jgi:hypothetical protein